MTDKIQHRRKTDAAGFAQISHLIALDHDLSDGAYRTYAILLKYAQQKGHAYPGVTRLAEDRSRSEPSVQRDLRELKERGLISRARRRGTSSMTYIEDIEPIYSESITSDGSESITHDVTVPSPMMGKEEEEDKKKGTEKFEEEKGHLSSYTPGPGQLVACEDPDTGKEVGEEDWHAPTTQLQRQVLLVCRGEHGRFHSKAERNKLKRIEAMLGTGKLPEEFWKNRLWSAEQYRWSLPKLLKYTLSEDSLRDWEAKQ